MLLERDAELERLSDLLAGVEYRGGTVVLIRGEAGIGKSSLVAEFIDRHDEESHVYVGSCDDLFIPQTLAPFWDMARNELSLKGPLEDGSRPRFLEAVLDLLSGSLRSAILVIEDSQWADEATLDAVRYLGRRIASTNALIVLTYRDGLVDYDHPLRSVIGDLAPDRVVRIPLSGLSLSAITSLISDSNRDPVEVLAATDGNPFMATEMVAAEVGVVGSSLQDSVMARVSKMSTDSQAMLKTLSTIPEPMDTQDALGLMGVTREHLEECDKRGFLDLDRNQVRFHHELIRRAIQSALTSSEKTAAHRIVLDDLPEEAHPNVIIHCAVEINDVDRLLDLAPRSARYAASMGSHREAVEEFRELGPHLDRFDVFERASILDEWSKEELVANNISEAIRLNELACEIYRAAGDRKALSRSLAESSHLLENLGLRELAEQAAEEAVEVLGSDPDGSALATALEANAYLQMMAGNVVNTSELVERTLEVAGAETDERIIIRSLNHRGLVANIANYPDGRESLEDARVRSRAGGHRYEEVRAVLLQCWAAAEFRDLSVASEYAQKAIALAASYEIAGLESYSSALYARVLELEGRWAEAADLARDLLDTVSITQLIAVPILGVIEARKGRATAHAMLNSAWEMASLADEYQRLGPAAIAVAEHAWISGVADVPVAEMKKILATGIEHSFKWSTGALAFWLWKLGELSEAPEGIAEPYRLSMKGEPEAAAEMWSAIGCPYERALALTDGDPASQLVALEILETLEASAVAAKVREALKDQGVSIPRGKEHKTRDHAAGLTARQAEVLESLREGLTNIQIADRLFVSVRTVEHHVAAILSKLDSSTRQQAVANAIARGLFAPR